MSLTEENISPDGITGNMVNISLNYRRTDMDDYSYLTIWKSFHMSLFFFTCFFWRAQSMVFGSPVYILKDHNQDQQGDTASRRVLKPSTQFWSLISHMDTPALPEVNPESRARRKHWGSSGVGGTKGRKDHSWDGWTSHIVLGPNLDQCVQGKCPTHCTIALVPSVVFCF